MRRKAVGGRKDKAYFRRTAVTTKAENLRPLSLNRGGRRR